MVMERIGFIRHGITDWNVEKRVQGQLDIPLNEQGRSQARALADWLHRGDWDVICASDLARAAETARIVSEKLGLPVTTDERLREVQYGRQEGTTLADRMRRWGDRHDQIDWELEEEAAVIQRGIAAIADMVSRHPGKRILIVSHGEMLEVLMATLLGRPIERDVLHNTAFSVFTHREGAWECEQFNSIQHLGNP